MHQNYGTSKTHLWKKNFESKFVQETLVQKASMTEYVKDLLLNCEIMFLNLIEV